MFHPDGVRRQVTNWPEVAEALVRRVRREAIGGVADERAQRILDEVLAYPDVPASLRSLDASAPLLPIVPIRYARGDLRFDYFSTVTTLGTPQDVTLLAAIHTIAEGDALLSPKATQALIRRFLSQPTTSEPTPASCTVRGRRSRQVTAVVRIAGPGPASALCR